MYRGCREGELTVSAIRSFIAVEIPESARAYLAGLQAGLKRSCSCPVKWVEPGNMHLTLKFLGNVDTGLIPEVRRAMDAAASSSSRCRLEVTGVGSFPGGDRIRVIWAGLAGEVDILQHLQAALDNGLAGLGFPPEERPFRPHLTLGRVREGASRAERESCVRALAGLPETPAMPFPVDSIHLIKSQLTPNGPVYSRLATSALK